MTLYRIENMTSGEILGDFDAEDEGAAIRSLLEESACTDEIPDDIRAFEIVTLGHWSGTLESAFYYMNDELRERLQASLKCRDQEWLDTYCRMHEKVFGKTFCINLYDPIVRGEETHESP